VRQGFFDGDHFERVLTLISGLVVEDSDVVPRRAVSLLWTIPIFMEWQVERLKEAGGDLAAYDMAITRMRNELERLLGIP